MSEDAKADEPRNAHAPAPEPAPAAEPRRRALSLPEGSLAIVLLLLFASVAGGLVATYWPALFGTENQVSDERVTALEARVGQLATGHSGAAASGVFADLRHSLSALSDRLEADEARLTALEKTAPVTAPAPAAPGQPAPANVAPALHSGIDAASATVAQLSARLDRLERGTATAEQLSATSDSVAKLQARIAALDADIARFSETQKGTMDAVNARLAKIEAALPPDLAQRLAELAAKADLTAVDTRVTRLEAQNAGDALHRAAAILALANVANAAADGRPFAVELNALAAAQPNDAALAMLKPWAATGVPTIAILRARFPAAARRALDVVPIAPGADFFTRLWANIEGLISVRRVGEVGGKDVDARLARAQVRVDASDLAGAIVEVSAVGGPSAIPLGPWLRDARSRVAVDQAIAQMNARVVHALATAPTAPAMPAPAPAPAQVPAPAP